MGYYHDIRLVTTDKGWAKLTKSMQQWAKDHANGTAFGDYVAAMFEPKFVHTGAGLVYVGWEWIKWRDWASETPEYEFMRVLHSMSEPYHLIRKGEVDGDIDDEVEDDEYVLPELYTMVVFNDEEIETILAKVV